ncbi:MAG: hypothetical protein C6P35_02265 [Cohnella sp.]|nr:MAG: hypothetical protein C6P35_02265 [Cohnella sp.]
MSKQFIYKQISLPSEDELNDYKVLKEVAKTLGIEVPSRRPSEFDIAQIKTTVISKGKQNLSLIGTKMIGKILKIDCLKLVLYRLHKTTYQNKR